MSAPASVDGTQEPRPLSWRIALRTAVSRRALPQTMLAAFLVGSTLFTVNLASDVVRHGMSVTSSLQTFLTYFVPWMNATIGYAIGCRGGRPGEGGVPS